MEEKEVVNLFVAHLAEHGYPVLKVDSRPDEVERNQCDIDAIAGNFAIEHTSIDTIPDQRRNSDWFMKAAGLLEEELRGKLDYRLSVTLPYDGIQPGVDWNKIKVALRDWVLDKSTFLPKGSHLISDCPNIPFDFRASKRPAGHPGLLLFRSAPEDQTLPDRLRKLLCRKAKKLIRYKADGKMTIILLESNDIALMDEAIMWENLRAAFQNGLPPSVDKIWFVDTSIPENVIFFEMTEAINR